MKQIFAIISLAYMASCSSSDPHNTGLEGKPLPAFSLLMPDSITFINTGSIPDGKPIALFLFSPHCPYCKAQVKEIIDDMASLKNIQFYMATSFPFPEMKQFEDEFKLSKFSNVIVGRDTAFFTARYFDANVVPYLAIYGKDKKLNKVFVGQISSKQIKSVSEE